MGILRQAAMISNKVRAVMACAMDMATADDHPFPKHRHAAVITKGGSFLSTGRNHHQIHAEICALGPIEKPEGCSIYVARITRGGRQGLSLPCHNCMRALIRCGIKAAYFTLDHNGIGEVRL